MTWSLIRLTLARTPEYPDGSESHAYELVLPLDAEGMVDMQAFLAARARATVQRIRPGEAVGRGAILHKRAGWAFSYEPGDADDEDIFHLGSHALVVGNYITLTEPDGEKLPYRVAAVRPMD